MRISHMLLAATLWLGAGSAMSATEPSLPDNTTLKTQALQARVQWLSHDQLLWPPEVNTEQAKKLKAVLYHHPQAQLTAGTTLKGNQIALTYQKTLTETDPIVKNQPLLKGYHLFKVPLQAGPQLSSLLKEQIWAALQQPNGKITALASLQTAGILDELFSYSGPDLGVTFDEQTPSLKLWAPTAQEVNLQLFKPGQLERPQETLPLKEGHSGVWAIQGSPEWYGLFYRYEVKVYVPRTGKLTTYTVTDPYAISLSTNSQHSQIINLNDPALKPPGWDNLLRPDLRAPEDIVLYELHLRDFSAADLTVPPLYRGKYLAFTQLNSAGMQHLSQLAESGLTHVHLLPVFDIATIEEDETQQQNLQLPIGLPPDSKRPQQELAELREKDAYNWGYDPFHYGAPEGSYALNPQGPQRILEFRQMVQNLYHVGLKTVMDVVYNHTHATGDAPHSVLDKIVPNYYYRLDAQGQIQQTTCCPDTASEHAMMEKLMIDTLLRWARDYKINGFRFDLMGHHTTANLKNIRQALNKLRLEQDGIEGDHIYLYGEGWKFGSLDAQRPQQAMNQSNAFGMGIGTFNDRLRDAARGGNFDHSTRSDQGFINGLFTDPNHSDSNRDTPTEPQAQQAQLLNYMANIEIGLTGNLRDYPLQQPEGLHKGSQIRYRGTPGTGYTADPQEAITYVSAHDNYSLWDQITAKAPFQNAQRQPVTATPHDKANMQKLGLSLVLLSQGIPFLDSGIEILRSKSGDGDSYDSGDWFNALDFSYQSNGWGKGLPAAWRNLNEWPFWQTRLNDPSLKVTSAEISDTLAHTHRLLRLRTSSPLFKLRTANEVLKRISFLDHQGEAIPGLIAMHIRDEVPGEADLDPYRNQILVLFNARPEAFAFSHPLFKSITWQAEPSLSATIQLRTPQGNLKLHAPTFDENSLKPDPETGSVIVPARSVMAFYEAQR